MILICIFKDLTQPFGDRSGFLTHKIYEYGQKNSLFNNAT